MNKIQKESQQYKSQANLQKLNLDLYLSQDIEEESKNLQHAKDMALLHFFFNNIDKNKAGSVNKMELLDECLSNDQIAKVFLIYDQAGNQNFEVFYQIFQSIETEQEEEISWEEFLDFFQQFKKQQKQMLQKRQQQQHQVTFGVQKERSKIDKSACILSKRQLDLLNEIFNSFPSEDSQMQLVNRNDFVSALRNDIRFIKMHNSEAVQLAPFECYSFEQVVEKIEMHSIAADEVISWDEFMDYFYSFHLYCYKIFDDFKRSAILMDPTILKLLKQIYDNIPKIRDSKIITQKFIQQVRNSSECQFFMHKIAREPQGLSSVVTETVEQVLERMEYEADQLIEWQEIRQYFTIEGRPYAEQQEDQGYYSDPEIDEHRMKEHENFISENLKLGQRAQEAPSRIRSKSNKAQKKANQFKITVPQPFNFDKREKQKTKPIMVQKLERQLEELDEEDLRELKNKFKAKEIPKDILEPKFYQILEENQARRDEVKKTSIAMTKAREKPFSFYYRDLNKVRPEPDSPIREYFRANPIPWTTKVPLYKQMMTTMAEKREERIKRFAEESIRQSKLPPRMEMHERQKQFEQQNNKYEEEKFVYKARDVPDFQYLQQQFSESLQRKKQSFKPTQPLPFNFNESKRTMNNREYMDNENERTKTWGGAKIASVQNILSKPQSQPSTTLKTQQYMEISRKRMEERRLKEQQKLKEDKLRIEKQQAIGPRVRSSSAIVDRTEELENRKRQIIAMKKKEARELEIEYKKQMQEMQERVQKRPLLVEQAGMEQQHQKKTQEYPQNEKSYNQRRMNQEAYYNEEDYNENAQHYM